MQSLDKKNIYEKIPLLILQKYLFTFIFYYTTNTHIIKTTNPILSAYISILNNNKSINKHIKYQFMNSKLYSLPLYHTYLFI